MGLWTWLKQSGQKISAMKIHVLVKTNTITVDRKIAWRTWRAITPLAYLAAFFFITSGDCLLSPNISPFSYTTFKNTFLAPLHYRGMTIRNCGVRMNVRMMTWHIFIQLSWPGEQTRSKAWMVTFFFQDPLDVSFIVFTYLRTRSFAVFQWIKIILRRTNS